AKSAGLWAWMRAASSASSSRSSRVICPIRVTRAFATRSCGLRSRRASWRLSRARLLDRGRSELRLELGGDANEVPAQPVDHLGALGDQLVAIVGDHPDLHRPLVEMRHGQLIEP